MLARLLVGFVALFALGYTSAALLALATPGWDPAVDEAAEGPGLPIAGDISPRAAELEADDGLDAGVAAAVAGERPAWVLLLAQAAALLGKIWVVVPLVLVVAFVVWRRTGSLDALWLPAFAAASGLALSVSIKMLVFRPRPPDEVAVVDAFGPSYPSGHVIRAVAVYGAFAWLLSAARRRRRDRVVAWTAAALLVAAVGAGRVYEGAHWVTDVLASVVLGAGWLAIVLAASGFLTRGRGER